MANPRREYRKEWYNKNKERILSYNKHYRLKNKEKINQKIREYKKNHKEEIKKQNNEYREKNHDILLKNHKEYNKNNRTIINFKQREEFKKPEIKLKKKLYWREWYKKNKEGKIKKYFNKNKQKENYLNYSRKYNEKIKQKENERRKELGLPLVGEGFRKEIEMFVLLKRLFPNDEIQIHNQTILNGLELDAYIPSLKLAFEYQGKQHFLPCVLNQNTLYFQTEEELEIYKWRDQRKIELCKEKGIILIYINYNEKLSEQMILQKLKEKNIECIQKKI